MFAEEDYARQVRNAGASGYLNKADVSSGLKPAIDCVLGGGVYFRGQTPAVAGR
jgi:DNA-binding NarL/FixJ family response regulator